MANLVKRRETEGLSPPTWTWDPLRLMREMFRLDPFREMERGEWLEPTTGYTPTFEVKETKDSYVFKADLPGVSEKDLDINLTGNRLTVSGHREREEKHEGETYYTFERSYGSFSRSFSLPEGVDPDLTKAELHDGVLTLTVPKRPEVQPKKIPVGKGGAEKVTVKA